MSTGAVLSSSVLQVLDEFSKQVDRIEWPVGSPATILYTGLDGHLSRYQVRCKDGGRNHGNQKGQRPLMVVAPGDVLLKKHRDSH